MAMTLRPYQAEAKDAILHEWDEGRKRTLLVLPTGCGKTIVLAKVAENQVEQGGRVLIMAHRGELLDQAADKVKQVTGIDCAYEKTVPMRRLVHPPWGACFRSPSAPFSHCVRRSACRCSRRITIPR